MTQYTITFQPDGRSVAVDDTQTILEAAERVGVYINRLCGGEGICGRCKVIVRSGEVWAEPTAYLSRQEIQQGYVLACKCVPCSDAVIEVPQESRLQGAPRLNDEDAIRFSSTHVLSGDGTAFQHDPLSQKRALTLPPPSLEDYLGDLERLSREIQRETSIPVMQIGLAPLQQLSTLLREHQWKVTATLGQRGETVEILQLEGGDTANRHYGLAVDIGTTTVVAHLVDLVTSHTLGRQATYNSQIQFGEDVITRIIYAGTRDLLAKLAACVVKDINTLIAGLVSAAGIALHDISYIQCAGNTTMMHLLLGLDPSEIRREPYIPVVNTPPVIRAVEVGIKINPRGLLGCVPSVASYVGGDIVADVLISGMARAEEPCMLIDVGTNAEIAVGNKDWLMCCSASAGPTFEGGGISRGMRATQGAIERLTMRNHGQIVSYSAIGGGSPRGLCGSGLMDTVAELMRNGCIERNGNFSPENLSGRLRLTDEGAEFLLVEGAQAADGKPIMITQADLANFIHAKGAIYHACDCLLASIGLNFTDLQTVYISGGFGNYLDIRKGIMIGLLPDIAVDRFQFIGNGSVAGAKAILLSRQAQAEATAIAANMTYIELSTDPKFMNEYSSALFLPHTDIERFPSVHMELMASRS